MFNVRGFLLFVKKEAIQGISISKEHIRDRKVDGFGDCAELGVYGDVALRKVFVESYEHLLQKIDLVAGEFGIDPSSIGFLEVQGSIKVSDYDSLKSSMPIDRSEIARREIRKKSAYKMGEILYKETDPKVIGRLKEVLNNLEIPANHEDLIAGYASQSYAVDKTKADFERQIGVKLNKTI